MKKFLSLVLALVMTMSLVTISAGAKTFEDDAVIDYNEAVEVMKAAGVVDGYADGSFNPSATLTRGAAAKIICNMILGPTNAGALSVTEAPFKDVPANNVFAGYISYCVSEGIISGYADGTFRPAATLTGYAFMKMLLGALGYDAAVEGYTGANWAVNVAKRALNIGLDDDLINDFNGTKAVTRQEACLYAFNAMKTPMVKYPNSSTVTIGDIQISTSAAAEEITTEKDAATVAGIKNGDGKVEFAEKFFPKLVLSATTDDYGRPAHKWKYDKDTVGTYVDDAALVYTTAVKGTVMADDIDDADLDVADDVYLTVNGYAVSADVEGNFTADLKDKADIPYTGKGVQFELYTNSKDEINKIVVIYSVLAKVTGIVEDKASTKSVDESNITVSAGNFGSVTAYAEAPSSTGIKAIGFKDVYGNVKVDDYVIVVPKATRYSADAFSWGNGNFFTASQAISIAVPETVKGVMTYKNTSNGSVKIDGTSYSMAYSFGDDTACAVSDKSVVAYVDSFGYLMMVDGVSATADKSVAVLDKYQTLDKTGKLVWMIKGVTSNGETVNWQVDTDASVAFGAGDVYTYTEDSSVYTLATPKTTVDAYIATDDVHLTTAQAGETYKVMVDTSEAITTSTKKICTYFDADDTATTAKAYTYFADTVKFIFVSNNSGKYVATVKEGAQKVDAGAELVITINDDGEISTVYVLASAKNSIDTSDALVMLAKETGTVTVYDKATEKYVKRFTYDAYVNGVKVEDFYADVSGAAAGSFYKNEVDTDTGAYVLRGNEFTGDADYGKVTGSLTATDDSWYKSAKLIVVGGADLGITSKTVFADNTGHEVNSLAALKNFVVTERMTSSISVLYDVETGEALYVYVIGATYVP